MITRMPFHKSFQDGITIFAFLFAALIGTARSSSEQRGAHRNSTVK